MTRTRRCPTTKELAQEKRIEKLVWKFIAGISHEVAVITSVRVAMQLSHEWDITKAEIDSRGENPFVYHIYEEDRRWLTSAVATCSRSLIWSSCPHKRVASMLTDNVPSDVAAFLAGRIAKEICWKERF